VSILVDNIGSIRMCEKAGFKAEGVSRGSAFFAQHHMQVAAAGATRPRSNLPRWIGADRDAIARRGARTPNQCAG